MQPAASKSSSLESHRPTAALKIAPIVTGVARTLLGLAFGLSIACSAAAEDSTALPAEAEKVLGLFVGQWETQARIGERDLRGRAQGKWVLGGRFVEFHTESVPPGQSEIQIMTYDRDAMTYRQWVFDSDGYTHEATGEWDEAGTTLVWRGKSRFGRFVIDDRWVSPSRLEWRMRRSAESGELVEAIVGVVSKAE